MNGLHVSQCYAVATPKMKAQLPAGYNRRNRSHYLHHGNTIPWILIINITWGKEKCCTKENILLASKYIYSSISFLYKYLTFKKKKKADLRSREELLWELLAWVVLKMKNTEPPLRDRHTLWETIIRVSEPDGRSDSSWFNPWCFSNALVIPDTCQKWTLIISYHTHFSWKII